MVTSTEGLMQSRGAQLNAMLEGQRVFLENIYGLMRFLEADLTKRGWELIRNGGYGVTRNGRGVGLANFSSADWVLTQMGVAFVRVGQSKLEAGVTTTPIPVGGRLDLLAYQVRWLDKSSGEPVIWRMNLWLESIGEKPPKKWEEYQTWAFNRLEPEAGISADGSGPIKPVKYAGSGVSVVLTGEFTAVPVTSIMSQQDVVAHLIDVLQVDGQLGP
jgi:hypothetical protein